MSRLPIDSAVNGSLERRVKSGKKKGSNHVYPFWALARNTITWHPPALSISWNLPPDLVADVLQEQAMSICILLAIYMEREREGLGKTDRRTETESREKLFFVVVFTFTFYNCIVPNRFLPWEIRVAFLAESQLRQSRASQATVHAGCFRISIVHRTLTWTRGSLTCAQM